MSASWARIESDYLTNPKILAVDQEAVLLHLASILWCRAHLETDGGVPKGALSLLAAQARVTRPKRAADQLVDRGLYVPIGDGWHLHDFETLNGSESEAETQRDKWRERKAAYRAKQKTLAETNGETNGETPP